MSACSPARILIFRPGAQLGDSIVTLPALALVAAKHPTARITLLTDAEHSSERFEPWKLLGYTSKLHDSVQYPKPGSGINRLLQALRAAWEIRRQRYDRLYYLAPNPRTEVQVRRDRLYFRFCCNIRDIRGLGATDGWVGQRDAFGPKRQPAEALRLARVVDPEVTQATTVLPLQPQDENAGEAFWNSQGVPSDALVVALGPGTKSQSTQWPLERFTETVRELFAAYPGMYIFVVGGSREAAFAQSLHAEFGAHVIAAAGRLSVWECAAALRRCICYVGCNSGQMHLAAAVGVPCVAVSSARDYPGMWEPQGANHVVLYKNVPCAGCLLYVCIENAKICLREISVTEVVQATSTLIAQQSTA